MLSINCESTFHSCSEKSLHYENNQHIGVFFNILLDELDLDEGEVEPLNENGKPNVVNRKEHKQFKSMSIGFLEWVRAKYGENQQQLRNVIQSVVAHRLNELANHCSIEVDLGFEMEPSTVQEILGESS